MNVVLLCHSLLSDWNNEAAHFQRGVLTELAQRGHRVRVLEPEDAWSARNLIADTGVEFLRGARFLYPDLAPERYRLEELDLDEALDGADLVIVHGWNAPELIRRVGEHRAQSGRYLLLYHDTHHRTLASVDELPIHDVSQFDGVLAAGEALRQCYVKRGFGKRAWTWHEAADTRIFHPYPELEKSGHLVWVGNYGDEERSLELREFLFEPARRIGLRGSVYGVRYPESALSLLDVSGLTYRGWLANYRIPRAFARFCVTVHVPQRPYGRALPGLPTIRPFEALACGIPLVSAPWSDEDGLFRPGDFLMAKNGVEMEAHLRAVLSDPELSRALAQAGLETVLGRHTCAHRVDELLQICGTIGLRGLSRSGEWRRAPEAAIARGA